MAALDQVRGVRGKSIPAWLIALVPLAGFTLQEYAERFAHSGDVPWAAALEATFIVGLALQLPFAALAFVAARALLRTVVAVVAALQKQQQPVGRNRVRSRRAVCVRAAAATGLSRSLAPRGPPSLSIA